MATWIRQRPPGWFVVVAAVLVIWGLLGCVAFYMHVTLGPAMDPAATDWDRAYYAALPGWFTPVYAAAVGGGLLGAIALLLRSKLALPLFLVSLIAVIVQFGYVFLGTDMLAHKGAGPTVPFPLFIAAVAAFQIWLAQFARQRGWIS
ncbi:hypothetical protein Q9Q95_09215 [Sphingomonas sp. DG1-23]|uniref:hypothetical protein n=1 Tax=Sphingomonas sp. DG1-23 TaxID=3068316 RepID=UPI00273E3FB8|nr:hypothetical protein [Sphingomonas sp. DG1-23]MDP5279102.1 hypothetical protein [Sphingomonas sp. DG1-23]